MKSDAASSEAEFNEHAAKAIKAITVPIANRIAAVVVDACLQDENTFFHLNVDDDNVPLIALQFGDLYSDVVAYPMKEVPFSEIIADEVGYFDDPGNDCAPALDAWIAALEAALVSFRAVRAKRAMMK